MNPPRPADRAGRRRRRRWLLAAVVAVLAVWMVLPDEPQHDGLSLSEWVAAPAEAGRSPEDAAAALRAMEPRATATLLRWLQTRESRLRRRLCELAARQNWFTLEPDQAWERREWAMSGFALLGTNAAPAIPRLARLVDDPEIGPAALGALRGIGLPSAPVLLAALTNNNAEARNGIVRILAGEPFIDLPQALPSLLRALDDRDYQVQLTALGALAHCERQPQVVWPALAQRARDTNFAGRALALRALADAQAPADLAVPVFVAALADGNVESRRVAIAGLLRVEGDAALEPLLRALEDTDVAVRAKAAVGLGKFTQHIDRTLPLLHARLTNDLPVVRIAAANGLSKFGPAARRVVPDLLALLRESSSLPQQMMLQNTAGRALLKIDPEAAAQADIRPEEPPPARGRGRRGASLDMPPPASPPPQPE
jgi:HEAT repeat protein